jgi:hypothetical protein
MRDENERQAQGRKRFTDEMAAAGDDAREHLQNRCRAQLQELDISAAGKEYARATHVNKEVARKRMTTFVACRVAGETACASW